ncbi:hypothetical protein Droror1_Dr00020293 [Drosera rotundifolia]
MICSQWCNKKAGGKRLKLEGNTLTLLVVENVGCGENNKCTRMNISNQTQFKATEIPIRRIHQLLEATNLSPKPPTESQYCRKILELQSSKSTTPSHGQNESTIQQINNTISSTHHTSKQPNSHNTRV